MGHLEQIADTYAWYHGVGNQVEAGHLARYVRNVEHLEIWVANHVSGVRASDPEAIDGVLKHADRLFAHCAHRMFIVDPLTPAAFVARLALIGFAELTPTLHMVLEGSLATSGSGRVAGAVGLDLQPVATDADWHQLYLLVRANHLEGNSSHHMRFEDVVTRRMVAGYRAKAGVSQFFLGRVDGVPCAYGSAVLGPHRMGIVEDLFTLPAYRLRGIATAMIAHCVAHARASGLGPILIGAHVDETPKALYAALGFVPRCVTRQYLLDQVGPRGA